MNQQCSTRVAWDTWHTKPCEKPAVVVRNGKSYCRIHDPEYIKAKEVKRSAQKKERGCPKCHSERHYPFWHFCSICGTKFPTIKEAK